MKKVRLVALVVLVALALSGVLVPQRAETASVDPSWEILEGEPDSCSGDGISGFSIMVEVKASAPASEKGQFVVPGYGQVGYTVDSSFSGDGEFSFFVFASAPYSVPDHTPVTLTVTTYNGANYTGGVSYVSTMTWDCTTGEEIVAGCDVLMPIPATAVGGTFVADAPVYWEPGELTSPLVTIKAGNTARVLGLDASGQYYKIIWVCDFLWVPKATLGPNYDAVWNGAPLPTGVVE